jgi:hypothetical protein
MNMEEKKKKENSSIIELKGKETNKKKILEFSSYVKIEKNGLDITKNLNINSICQIEIIQSLDTPNIEIVVKKTKPIESIFKFDLCQITRIIDKFIKEEKMTINISKVKGGKENFTLFLYKTNEQVLDNFKNTLFKLVDKSKSAQTLENKGKELEKKTKIVEVIEIKDTSNDNHINEIIKNKLAKKKKFKELLTNPDKFIAQQEALDQSKILKIREYKKGFMDIPIEMLDNVLSFVDTHSKFKVSVLNKRLKRLFDETYCNLKFRADTPSNIIHRLLSRYKNLYSIEFGKLKNVKNEIFKDLSQVNLTLLIELNISDIIVLNETSINKLFSHAKQNLRILKINYLLEGFFAAIRYIEFFKELEELYICTKLSNFTKIISENKFNTLLEEIKSKSLFFSYNTFKLISESLKNKKLKRFSIFLWNFYLYKFPIFDCASLDIDFAILENLENLNFLNDCKTLSELKLNHLTMLTRCNTDELYKFPDSKEKIFEFNNFSLKKIHFPYFDNSIEIFTIIFRNLKNLISLELGSFANNETIRIISLYSTEIKELSISSYDITDDYFINILTNCKRLEKIDLRGSSRIDGTCFLNENLVINENLKDLKLNVINFNSDRLIELLQNKGINAQNYLYY